MRWAFFRLLPTAPLKKYIEQVGNNTRKRCGDRRSSGGAAQPVGKGGHTGNGPSHPPRRRRRRRRRASGKRLWPPSFPQHPDRSRCRERCRAGWPGTAARDRQPWGRPPRPPRRRRGPRDPTQRKARGQCVNRQPNKCRCFFFNEGRVGQRAEEPKKVGHWKWQEVGEKLEGRVPVQRRWRAGPRG